VPGLLFGAHGREHQQRCSEDDDKAICGLTVLLAITCSYGLSSNSVPGGANGNS
jgi:hypothetical protein